MQAAVDARGAAAAQTAWLRAQMGPHFSRKLLQVTREIEKRISLHDGNPAHRFPVLAGSYLTEVCQSSPNPNPRTLLTEVCGLCPSNAYPNPVDESFSITVNSSWRGRAVAVKAE